jgi:hypothetical protein
MRGLSQPKNQMLSERPHLVYRIMPEVIRSPRAFASHADLEIVDVAPVVAESLDQSQREHAAVHAHAKVMEALLSSGRPYCVVLEDDAILGPDRTWMRFLDYDLFLPFSHNREHVPMDSRIREGQLPRYGAFAYLCSRRYAERYHQLLLKGGLADVISHHAAKGMRYASFAGNAVNHDNDAPSLISEDRRKAFLAANPTSARRSWLQRALGGFR